MQKTLWFIIFIVLIAVVGVLIINRAPVDYNNDTTNDNDEKTMVQKLFERLPYETNIKGQTIIFDTESVEQISHEEYARLPYEVEIGGEIRLIETTVTSKSEESPVDFVERFIEEGMPSLEEMESYDGENMYRHSVSFYKMNEEETSKYPADDNSTNETAKEGVSTYVRVMGFPDDSIGGTENRFDFIVSSQNEWILVWHGERNFCRRLDNEFWQPANELCP